MTRINCPSLSISLLFILVFCISSFYKFYINEYMMMMTRVPELIPFLGSQPACDVSHKPGARLPLLSARPAVTFPARRPVPISLPGEQRHDGCEQFARDCYPTSSRYVASFSSRNQAIVDSDTTPDPELHPDGTVRIYAAVSNPCYSLMSLYCVAHSWSVCANMTSPIKPEVHNISQRARIRPSHGHR